MEMKTLKQSTLALMVAACFSAAIAAPTLPQVVNGQATFSQQGNVFSITNTPNTIINWQSFSVNPGEITRFIQQDANSAVLNRILGALQSNGRVFLINPNGILFGRDARVDVNGLVASTLDLSNADFLAGKKNFTAGPSAGNVSNQGAISTPGGGQVFLIAPNVENSGVITSPKGEVVLAAGHTVQLVDSANPDLHVVVSAPANQAVNLGQVIAQGGKVGIYGALVNQRGVVNANSAQVGENGKIVLKASGDTLLEAGSVTSATGAGKGGTIEVLGDRVGLIGDAQLDASGAAGGGTVLVGGDYQGKNAAIQNARQVFIDKDVSIRADAQQSGDGGKVIAWSDGLTRAYGKISARGGANGGDGGFVETSGHVLDMQGSADTRAPKGKTGTLLLDPTNIYIANDVTSAQGAGMTGVDISASSSPFVGVGNIADSLLSVSALQAQLALSNVTVSTTNASGTGAGNIKVVNPVSWNSAYQLFLNADGGIAVNNSIASTGGALSLTSHSSAGITLNGSLSGTNLSLRAYLGDITQPSGAITATSLLAYADDGAVTLANSSNNVGTLAGWSGVHGSGFTFSNYNNLIVDVASGSHGVISNHGPISLSTQAGTLTVNDLTYGVKAAGSNDSVTLSALGGALQIAGVVQTNGGMATLTGATAVNLTGSGSVSTAGGAVLANATNPGGQFSMGAATQVSSGGGNIGITADDMGLGGTAAGGAINSGAGGVSLTTNTSGTGITVGANAQSASSQLRLTDTELATIKTTNSTTGALVIATHGAGAVVVDGALNLTAPGHLVGGLSLVTDSGSLTVNASSPVTVPNALFLYTTGALAVNSALSAGSTVLLEANKMNLAGAITAPAGAQLVAPGASIDVGSTVDTGSALELSAAELNQITAPSLSIITNTGDIGVTTAVIAPSHISSSILLSAPGNITVGASTGLTSPGGLYLTATNGMLTNAGALKGSNVSLTAPKMALAGGSITGSLSVDLNSGAADIWLGAASTDLTANTLELSSAELNTVHAPVLRAVSSGAGNIVIKSPLANGVGGAFEHLTATSTLTLQTVTGSISQASGATVGGVNQLSLRGNGVSMMEPNSTGVVSGSSNGDFAFHSANPVSLSYVDGVHGVSAGTEHVVTLMSDSGISQLSGNPLTVPSGNLILNAQGSATLTDTGNNFRFLAAALNFGAGGRGSSSIYNSGDMQVFTGTFADAPYHGIDNGNQNLQLTVGAGSVTLSDHIVTTGTGAVTLTAGAASSPTTSNVVNFEAAVTAPGGLTVNANRVAGSLAPVAGPHVTLNVVGALPTLAACITNPNLSGCASVLPTLTACITNPGLNGCSVVLPTLAACITNPSLNACSVVLPTLAQCISQPGTAGCAVILPALSTCTDSPTTAGCSVVLPALSTCVSAPTIAGCSVILPSLPSCVSAPATPGCSAVLPSLAICIGAPATAGCSVVLPGIGLCTSSPSTPGCSVVLPTLAACVAAPTTAGCSAVLPSLPTCAAAPTTAGCVAVLPPLTACITNPTALGCAVVLPTLPACIASPTTAGCSVVLPSLPACVAAPTAPGCSVVLPSLPACVAAPTAPGCSVVLPSLPACIANPSSTGCSVVLPSMAACIGAPSTAGCSVVLPTLPQCTANPSAAGCSVVLPKLSACVAAPTTVGCSAVLPTLAQCTASPSLQGCTVVLPPVDTCAVNPNAAGCTAVLPTASFCDTHPADATCTTIKPPAGGSDNTPIAQALNATVNIINATTTTVAVRSPSVATSTTGTSGTGGSAGGTSGTDSKKDDTKKDDKLDTASTDKSGVKNEPSKKMYCN